MMFSALLSSIQTGFMKVIDPFLGTGGSQMRVKQKYRRRASRPARHMTSTEFRAITYIATLVLAGIAIILRINDPVVWSFLGTAIGIALGQAMHHDKNR
jgi:hypothetical protein